MQTRELDSSWRDWINHNISRGCSKEGMLEILIENGFTPEIARQALNAPPPISPPPSAPPRPHTPEETELTYAPDKVHVPFAEVMDTQEKAELMRVRRFLSEEECVELILLANQHLRASTTTNDKGEYEGFRTSRTCDLGLIRHPLVEDIERRICQVMGIDPSWSEPIQAQRYDVGQQFKAHTDYFEPNTAEFETYARGRGQRTWTFMIYLNTTQEGGETFFTALGQEFRPSQGDAVIWNNLLADGTPNPNTMHWGKPVVTGYKMVLTKWFRDKGNSPMFTKTPNEYLHPYTKSGFLKTRVPEALLGRVLEFYKNNQATTVDERVPGFIDAAGGKPASELIPLPDELKQDVHNTLQPVVEAWIGTPVVPTFVFGIRRYLSGAVLKMHRDRGITHVASAIINVSQDTRSAWPLEIEDHYGRHYHLLLEPGDMVLYEGARLLHGRPLPLEGTQVSNMFVHYKIPMAQP